MFAARSPSCFVFCLFARVARMNADVPPGLANRVLLVILEPLPGVIVSCSEILLPCSRRRDVSPTEAWQAARHSPCENAITTMTNDDDDHGDDDGDGDDLDDGDDGDDHDSDDKGDSSARSINSRATQTDPRRGRHVAAHGRWHACEWLAHRRMRVAVAPSPPRSSFWACSARAW